MRRDHFKGYKMETKRIAIRENLKSGKIDLKPHLLSSLAKATFSFTYFIAKSIIPRMEYSTIKAMMPGSIGKYLHVACLPLIMKRKSASELTEMFQDIVNGFPKDDQIEIMEAYQRVSNALENSDLLPTKNLELEIWDMMFNIIMANELGAAIDFKDLDPKLTLMASMYSSVIDRTYLCATTEAKLNYSLFVEWHGEDLAKIMIYTKAIPLNIDEKFTSLIKYYKRMHFNYFKRRDIPKEARIVVIAARMNGLNKIHTLTEDERLKQIAFTHSTFRSAFNFLQGEIRFIFDFYFESIKSSFKKDYRFVEENKPSVDKQSIIYSKKEALEAIVIYSKELVNRSVEELEVILLAELHNRFLDEDKAAIIDAYESAKQAHADTKEVRITSDLPYIHHVLVTSLIGLKMGALMNYSYVETKELLIAALYHDTIENTKIFGTSDPSVQLNEIAKKHGEKVAIIVLQVTKLPIYINKEHDSLRADYKKRNLDSFSFREVLKSARVLKVSDRIANLHDLNGAKRSFIERQLIYSDAYFKQILKYLSTEFGSFFYSLLVDLKDYYGWDENTQHITQNYEKKADSAQI